MCGCDHDEATGCSKAQPGKPCDCECHEHRATTPMPAAPGPYQTVAAASGVLAQRETRAPGAEETDATPAEVRRLRAMELYFERIIRAVDACPPGGGVEVGAEAIRTVVAYRNQGEGKWARAIPMPPVASYAPEAVHRVRVEAFNAAGETVYLLEAVEPGEPGHLRFNVAHTIEGGRPQTRVAIDVLEREGD